MADYLGDLSRGLRLAAGVLNPDVQRQTNAADERRETLEQQNQFDLQKMQQQFQLQQSTPQAQMAQQQLQDMQGYRKEVEMLGSEATPEAVAMVGIKYGKPELAMQMYKSIEDRAERAQRAIDANASRMQVAEMQHEARMASTANIEGRNAEAARHNRAMEALKSQSMSLQAAIAGGNQELRRLQLSLMGQGKEEKREQAVDQFTTKFANQLQQSKIPALQSSLENANNLLKKYEGKDVPGFGAVEGSAKIPNILRSAEANDVRSAVTGVTNDLLNLYSGLAVTLPEAERRQLEQMTSGDFTQADFKNAWPRIVSRFNTIKGNLVAGAAPQVREKYQTRPGAISLEPLKPAFENKGSASGEWTVKEKK